MLGAQELAPCVQGLTQVHKLNSLCVPRGFSDCFCLLLGKTNIILTEYMFLFTLVTKNFEVKFKAYF